MAGGAPGVYYLDAYWRDLHIHTMLSFLFVFGTEECFSPPLPFSTMLSSIQSGLNAPSTRRVRIVLQLEQQVPHPLLGAALSTTALPFPAQIRQFRNPLPARSSRCGVLAVLNEFGGLTCGLGFLFVDLDFENSYPAIDTQNQVGTPMNSADILLLG